jgi:hypothetical protein
MSTPDNRPDDRPDARFEQRARELYLEASRKLDPATAGRLRAVRRTALQSAAAPRHALLGRALLPVGALAAIALATLMVWQPQRQATTAPARVTALASADQADNELPPDPDSTDPGLYQNLDFYGWLAASDSPARH